MAALLVCTAVALVIGLVVFLDVRRDARERLNRSHYANEMQQRRHDRAVANAAAVRGEFRCTSCGKVCPTVDAEKIGEIAAAFDASLAPDAPRIVVCDDCYRSIMGEEPPRLYLVSNEEGKS